MKKALLLLSFLLSHLFFAQNNDCSTAIPICSNANITLTPSGSGNSDEGTGCMSGGEHNSIWFTFSTLTAGTLTFVITPALNVDYDWALYGPNQTCTQIQTVDPIRCSYDAPGPGQYATGLNLTSLDTSEGAGIDNLGNSSDGMVKYIDVLPGQIYYLLIDQFSGTSSQFSLTFGGSAGLLTPFGDPVLQPYPFIAPGPNQDGKIDVCGNPFLFDFSTLTAGIVNGNPNFIVRYYLSAQNALDNVGAITAPVLVNPTATYHYAISYSDPTSPASFLNNCKQFGTIKFFDRSFTTNNATLTECSNNNSGTATYNLTTANIGLVTGLTAKYYPTQSDANNNTNEITNPYVYVSGAGKVFAKVTNQYNCIRISEITLNFNPLVVVNPASLRSCFIEGTPSLGSFNLINATVNSQTGTTKEYYPSETDAINQTNPIPNPGAYIAPTGVIYIRVMNATNCYAVAKVTLEVLPPVYSSVLIDKAVCMEDKTTLDAGTGFDGYEWSNGETTQVISGVGVGTYWVRLKTGDCWTKQEVKIFPSEQPVLSNIEITNNTITVFVTGGTPAYSYSLDNNNWQESNIFKDISRGDHTVYIKDAFDCEPIAVDVVVPNIINVITPNGDGVNDVIDYSALSNKKNLILNIYDRYGTKIHQADKMNNYKWDGTVGGKKVPTGTYWYSVTWNENNKNSTPIKFSGWVMLKNRD
ncbi:chromophore lyase [Chryseobacterium sp. Leaf404]|uniref:T9SS type B sorting domain-containing protein n=1 Tax=unclassified Chryseobacterium TaxID=2593645 RepID=UPI0006FF962C|nr:MULTISPECIES: T9SS type B sorting domain-containing protein [unclassified Chryseobacterium]KQT15548.1 chromophore lyase [Chryseobacterium sp. Leaf404]